MLHHNAARASNVDDAQHQSTRCRNSYVHVLWTHSDHTRRAPVSASCLCHIDPPLHPEVQPSTIKEGGPIHRSKGWHCGWSHGWRVADHQSYDLLLFTHGTSTSPTTSCSGRSRVCQLRYCKSNDRIFHAAGFYVPRAGRNEWTFGKIYAARPDATAIRQPIIHIRVSPPPLNIAPTELPAAEPAAQTSTPPPLVRGAGSLNKMTPLEQHPLHPPGA